MEPEKNDGDIDEQFCIPTLFRSYIADIVKVNGTVEDSKVLKSIADIYLSMHNIPFSRDVSGSSIVYRCPFRKDCQFRIQGGICRSKDINRKGNYGFMNSLIIV